MSKPNHYLAKTTKDKIWYWVSFSISILLALLFIAILVFVIVSAIPGFDVFGIDGILGTTEFNLSNNKAGIWGPISITLLVTFGSILIATPIGIKTATFIHFRVPKKYKRTAILIIQALSGIPSVIFGLFALNSLGKIVALIFGTNGAYNVINAIIMLSFMILPTIISLTLNAYENVSQGLLTNSISLGVTRTYGIYKIFKAKARNGILVAVIIAIGRAFGETMALSMILTSESYSILSDGIFATLNSSLGTLGSVIATNMFSETGGPAVRGVLYAFGILLFILIIILNYVIVFITRENKKSYKTLTIFKNALSNIVFWVPNTIKSFVTDWFIKTELNPNHNEVASINTYLHERVKKHKLANVKTYYWFFTEILSSFITIGFLLWICLDIICNGAYIVFRDQNINSGSLEYTSTAFQYGIDTTGQALVNTIIIIFVSLLISVPFSLMIAIYLNEYSRNKKMKKTILFFIDCLGSSPSIIFGMFGLAVFIEILGLSINGRMGRSLLAGSLTISIVILPALIRTIQQALEAVPNSVRESAYSLGCTKWETIWKVVIKHAYAAMMSSVVLAIGRIMAETAPLYLTSGLTSVSGIGLMIPGQTLTTRIYAQLAGDRPLAESLAIQYECAFIALIIVIFLIWIGCYVITNSKQIKLNLHNYWFSFVNIFIYRDNKKIIKFKKQIIKRTLYLTKEQALNSKIDYHCFKFIIFDKKIYRVKFVKKDNLIKLQDKVFVKQFEY